MNKTFSFRGSSVINDPQAVSAILATYPSLRCVDELFLEFGRILGEADVKETMSVDWKTRWSGKIINLAKREQQYYAINCWMDLYFSQRESEDLLCKGALLLLMSLSTTKKANLSHVLHVVKNSSDVNQEASKQENNCPMI